MDQHSRLSSDPSSRWKKWPMLSRGMSQAETIKQLINQPNLSFKNVIRNTLN